jgi:hypothetical protein
MVKNKPLKDHILHLVINYSLAITLLSPILVYILRYQESILLLGLLRSEGLGGLFSSVALNFDSMILVFYYGFFPVFATAALIGFFSAKSMLKRKSKVFEYEFKQLTVVILGSASFQLILLTFLLL